MYCVFEKNQTIFIYFASCLVICHFNHFLLCFPVHYFMLNKLKHVNATRLTGLSSAYLKIILTANPRLQWCI